MTRKALLSGLQTSFTVALLLSAAAIASLTEDGLQVAAAGLEMNVSTDFKQGVQISFIALD